MSWNPTKAHALDLMMMDQAAKDHPNHTVTVVNRWGVSVCGLYPPISIGRVRVVEIAEHHWEYA